MNKLDAYDIREILADLNFAGEMARRSADNQAPSCARVAAKYVDKARDRLMKAAISDVEVETMAC